MPELHCAEGVTGLPARVQATVDAQEILLYIEWHQRVIQRALELLPPAPASKQIAAFFHKKVHNLPPACLLDQVVSHCLEGMAAASRRTAASLKQSLQVCGISRTLSLACILCVQGPQLQCLCTCHSRSRSRFGLSRCLMKC